MSEFQGSATSTAFAPVRAADRTGAERDQLNQRLAWMREDNQAINENRRDVATGMAEVSRVKQLQRSTDLEALGQFSKTLTDTLLERQKQINQDQEDEGIQLYYLGGGDQKEIEAFREGEAKLEQASTAVNNIAYRAAVEGEPPRAVSAIKGLSGHKRLGYLKAMAQDLGGKYGSWLTNRITSDKTTQIRLGDRVVTPNDALRDESLLAGVSAWLRTAYIREHGLNAASNGMLVEHLFPEMRRGEARAIAQFSEQIITDRGARETEELESVFTSNMRTPGQRGAGLNAFVSALASTINPKTGRIYGRTGAIDRAFEIVTQLAADGEDAQMSTEAISELEGSADLDGTGTWGKRHALRFVGMRDKVRAGLASDYAAQEDALIKERDQWTKDVIQRGIALGGYTDNDIIKLKEAFAKSGWPGRFPSEILDFPTKEQQNASDSEAYIKGKLARNEPISQVERLRLDPEVVFKYRNDIEKAEKQFINNPDFDTNIRSITSALKESLDIQTTAATTDPTFDQALGYAKKDYMARVSTKIAGGMAPEAAHALAYTEIYKEIEAGRVKVSSTSGEKNQSGSGMYAVSALYDDKKGFTNFIPGGKGAKGFAAAAAAQVQLRQIQQTLVSSGMSKSVITKSRLVSDSDLATIERLRQDPQGDIPTSVRYVARTLGVSEWEVMDAQLVKLGKPPLTRPPSVMFADTLDPRFQELLNRRPSARRTRRALASVPWNSAKVPNGWGSVVEEAAARNGLDPALLAGLISAESSWNPRAVSSSKAKGLGQFLDATAREQGLSDPFNPVASIHAAAKYLRYSIDQFPGNLELGIRAYNRGVAGTVASPGGRTAEAREYPAKVLAHARGYGYGNTGSPWASPGMRNPRLVYKIDSLGYDSTGPHLDVKPVRRGTTSTDPSVRYVKGTLDNFVSVKVNGKLVPLSKGTVTTDNDAAHRVRKSFGHDYAADRGTELYLRNGAQVVYQGPGNGNSTVMIIETPNGDRFQFLHGRAA